MSLLGKLFYKYYYGPKVKKDIIAKFGGQENFEKINECEAKMKAYAFERLVIHHQFHQQGKYQLFFLSGEKFLHQTLFCIYSLFRFLTKEEAAQFSITILDDGSLSDSRKVFLANKYSGIRVLSLLDAVRQVESNLPRKKFPFIHEAIDGLILFKKLFFTHSDLRPGLKIFLDSDMLFVRRPDLFLEWIRINGEKKEKYFGIEDVGVNYGYSNSLITEISKTVTSVAINSGFYGINTSSLDFEYLEQILKKIITAEGIHYYCEQFVTGIILTKRPENLTVLPKSDYIVLPCERQVSMQDGVLHHYVDTSKEWYFKKGWERVIEGELALI
jgi:hypothetical protein